MINAAVLAELERQHTWIARIVDGHTKELAARWVQAWAQTESALEDALADLISDHPTVSAQIRAIRAAQMWTPAARQIAELARQASLDNHDLITMLVAAAADHQEALIEPQLPSLYRASINLMRPNPEAVDAIIDRTTQQITARYWMLQADAAEAMKQALIGSVMLGTNPRDAARAMVEAVGGAFNGSLIRAMVIARTEQLDAYRNSAMLFQRNNRDVLVGWQWVADLGGRTCRSCIAMHGSIHDLDEPGPLDHPQGRCSRAPLTKSWKELGFKNVPEPPGTIREGDGERWLTGQPKDVQDKILGKTGSDAWRNGDWPSTDWAELHHNDGWRDSYTAAKLPQTSAA